MGYGVASALGASGVNSGIAGLMTDAGVVTKPAGITSSMLYSGFVNMAVNHALGGDFDGAWKSGVTGLATGAWSITGGFGMVKGFGAKTSVGKLVGKLGYQMIGTVSQSVGSNWASGKGLFSKLTLGVGPVNFTIGKGQRLLQWENNLGNIAINSFGLINTIAGGKILFDVNNLTFVYKGGLIDVFYKPAYWSAGFSPHTVTGNSKLSKVFYHELLHLWHSRALNDMYLLNYGLHGLNALLLKGNFVKERNYYEDFVDYYRWW